MENLRHLKTAVLNYLRLLSDKSDINSLIDLLNDLKDEAEVYQARVDVTKEFIKIIVNHITEIQNKDQLKIFQDDLNKKMVEVINTNESDLVNLCDSCEQEMPICNASFNDIEFGNGLGKDNVIKCKGYIERVKENEN